MQREHATAEHHDSDGPPTGPPAGLYRRDFHAWASDQARALRQAADSRARGDAEAFREAIAGLDLENLAEEVAGLAKSEQRELRNRLTTVVEHLLKVQLSPAAEPRAGWQSTARRGRVEIARLLEDSPSLRAELYPLLDKARGDAWMLVLGELRDRGEAPAKGTAARASARAMHRALGDYTPERVLDPNWWPATDGGGT